MPRRASQRRSDTPAAQQSSLRIIGGAWRGRRISIVDTPGLRPTPDRIRETVFNWLAPIMDGARCLDLFAGTGVLGLEALSRGAGSALFIEQQTAAARALETSLSALGGQDRAVVYRANALATSLGGPFDIIFIDPPFADGLHARALDSAQSALAPHGRIYLEYPIGQRKTVHDLLKDRFELLREKKAGQVGFCLVRAVEQGANQG